MHIALLQIRPTSLRSGLPSPAKLLFNCPIRGIKPILCRLLISPNNDDEHYEVLVKRQTKKDKNHDTPKNYTFLLIGSAVAVQ